MSYLRAMADIDARLRAAVEQRAANSNLAAVLADEGEQNARLTRELAEAHTELLSLRQAVEDRNDLIEVLQAQVDELTKRPAR